VPSVTVIDASVVVAAAVDDGAAGRRARDWLASDALCAPDVIDLEVMSAIRRQVLVGLLPPERGTQIAKRLVALPIQRVRHRALVTRCWELRDNLTIYDAAYVALAEAVNTVLVTADGRLARAPGARCRIELIA
jgi:predicted nucleic acid-binding protein